MECVPLQISQERGACHKQLQFDWIILSEAELELWSDWLVNKS